MTGQWLGGLLMLCMAALTTSTTQISTISVKTVEVRVDVLVTQNGMPLHGLNLSDFEVLDNGVRQKVNFAGEFPTPFNTVLVLDMSSSVAGERLFNLKNAGRMLLDELKTDEHAALVTFSHAVLLHSKFTTDKEQVKAELDAVRSFGNTSIIDASYAALLVAESQPGRPLLIVFSDALDTSSWLSSDMVLYIAQRSDAVIYAITMGQHPKITFLRDLTEFTGGTLFKIESTKDLDKVFLNILEEFRQRYLVTYKPDDVAKPGWHQLEVRIKGKKYNVKARPGYFIDSTN